jgi:micrococcal nuclease
MLFGKRVEFARLRRNQARRRQPRMRAAPWLIAALVGVAGALWFAADLHPDAAGGNGALALRGNDALVLRGNGAGVTSGNRVVVLRENGAGALNENGVFTLCIAATQQNCVIDGDTIRYGGTKIRLEDIDTPETHEPGCASEAALGRRATRRLLELVNAGPFQLVRTGGRDEDRYGRKLRTITRGGRSMGDVLIAEGLARPWDGPGAAGAGELAREVVPGSHGLRRGHWGPLVAAGGPTAVLDQVV